MLDGEGDPERDGAGEPLLALVGADPEARLERWLAGSGAGWLLAGTAYPGNAGFVIRSAEVSGADGVVIDANFDRGERRECLRAAMRADRFFPVAFAPAAEAVAAARRGGRRIIAVEDSGGCAPWEADLTGAVLFVVGGERNGIPGALLAEADAVLRIPMAGFVSSYNLQAAMAVVMGERMRQLAADGPPSGSL
jgi:tRNA G18 (ribose-2'-O)-methylase SpoU